MQHIWTDKSSKQENRNQNISKRLSSFSLRNVLCKIDSGLALKPVVPYAYIDRFNTLTTEGDSRAANSSHQSISKCSEYPFNFYLLPCHFLNKSYIFLNKLRSIMTTVFSNFLGLVPCRTSRIKGARSRLWLRHLWLGLSFTPVLFQTSKSLTAGNDWWESNLGHKPGSTTASM